MKKILLVLLLMPLFLFSQEETENRGTIKIERKGLISKVIFDDVNYRLIGLDQYGNVLDSAVTEFKMSVTIKGIFYSEISAGPQLTYKMQQLLGKCDRTCIIFFENIKVRNRDGTLADMPRFRYVFAYSDENNN